MSLVGTKPRARVFRHLQRNAASQPIIQALSTTSFSKDGDNIGPDAIGEIEEGYAQLYSYYEPGLQGGTYEIQVNHDIRHPSFAATAPDPKKPAVAGAFPFSEAQILNAASTQRFNVNVPRFNLPPGIIHQTYPPQGLADHNNVLPHMVFEDVHLPWENEGSPSQDEVDNAVDDDVKTRSRSKVPWIALWTFNENELKLSATELLSREKGGLFPNTTQIPSHTIPPPEGREQDKATFGVKMTMGEYLEMGGWPAYQKQESRDPQDTKKGPSVTIPHFDNDEFEPIDRDEQVNVVFVKREIFEKHVCSYDDSGKQVPSTKADVSRYKYLAHVKNVNQIAMAGLDLPDKGLYSIVQAHRTGPLDITSATPRIVHLVSIMDIEDNITLPLDASKPETKWIALISLHAWTYLCMPPETVNFVDTMRGIGNMVHDGSECWLRASDKSIRAAAGLQASTAADTKKSVADALDGVTPEGKKTLKYKLAARLLDGYALQRYMLQTGEETACLFRGPLTPTYVPPIKTRAEDGWWPLQSNFSSDYQILDPNLGIMDITYSAAWQLGRTLGTADQAFTAALVRLRGAVVKTAWRQTKKIAVGSKLVKSKAEALASMTKSMQSLSDLGSAKAGDKAIPTINRSNKLVNPAPVVIAHQDGSANEPKSKVVLGALTTAGFRTVLNQRISNVAGGLAASLNSNGQPISMSDSEEVFKPFNEIDIPASPDWKLVQSWILDKLSLHNIPAHYLITDPSHLPQNTIRFFYIDSNWMDAFIDGALSIGNHLDREDDVVRQAFKRQINRYLSTPLGEGNHAYLPQIPSFGFFMRSSVVKAFPNLEVHAPWPVSEEMEGNRMETVRLDCLEKDTVLCLFDRLPGQPHWNEDQGQDGSRRTGITICQPPHQQCYRLGSSVNKDFVQMIYRSLYTREPNDLPAERSRYASLCSIKWRSVGGPKLVVSTQQPDGTFKDVESTPDLPLSQDRIFDYDTHMLVFPAFAKSCIDIQNAKMEFNNKDGVKTKYFEDDTPSSAVTAEILGSFVSVMNIEVPKAATTGSSDGSDQPPDATTVPRQIRLPVDADSDKTKWQVVPPDDPGADTTPKPKPPDRRNETTAPPLPSNSGQRPPRYPRGFSPDAFKFPNDQKTAGQTPLQVKISSQWITDAFVLGTNPVPKFNTVNDVPIFPPKHARFGVPIDLIIRIVPPLLPATQDKTHNLQIFSIDVDIPMGSDAGHLMEKYDGPGGTMINNQRWNVHVALSVTPVAKVTFTLIPRSTTRLSALSRNEDLTFAIWSIVPNQKEGRMLIKVTENYRSADTKVDNGAVRKHSAVSNADLKKVKVVS